MKCEREPAVRHTPDARTEELCRGDADDGEGCAVDNEVFANYRWVAVQLLFPIKMTEHYRGFSVRFVVIRCQHTAFHGAHAEQRKVVAGYKVTAGSHCRVGLRVDLPDAEPALTAAKRGEFLKRLVVLADVFVRGVREPIPFTPAWAIVA